MELKGVARRTHELVRYQTFTDFAVWGHKFVLKLNSAAGYDLSMPGDEEVDILSRVIDPNNPTLNPAAAEALLELAFSESDHARMSELARKSNEGSISEQEKRELGGFVFVGDVLSLLKAKARASLRKPAA